MNDRFLTSSNNFYYLNYPYKTPYFISKNYTLQNDKCNNILNKNEHIIVYITIFKLLKSKL